MRALPCAALVLALSGMGCTTKTISGPLVVSTHPLPELGTDGADAKRVAGESCNRVVLLLIPVGFGTVESAYADALSQVPGADTIVDYEERTNNLFIFPLYYEVCTEVHGYAVSSKSRGPATRSRQ
jgi:hypothetical protein